MNREDIKKLFKDEAHIVVDTCFDHFESRTCERCEFFNKGEAFLNDRVYDDGNDGICMLKCIPESKFTGEILEGKYYRRVCKDDSCNNFGKRG